MKNCIMLHGLGPTPPHILPCEVRYWLPEEKFAKIVNLAQRYPMQITFDDANDTDVRIALPALKKAGLSADFFVPTGQIGRPGYLSEGDIRSMRAVGMRFGSHGSAHIEWTKVSNDEIAKDVSGSIEILSAILGEQITDVAVPFGECDLRVMRVLRSLGVKRVYTSFRGRTSDDAWIVRRTCITANMPNAAIEELFARKYTAADDALAFLRAWRHIGPATLWAAS